MFFIYLMLATFTNPELNTIKEKLYKHNSIQIYESNNKALKYQKDGMKNYIAPTVSVGIRNLPLNFSYQDSAMTGNFFSIMQPLKWSDKFNKKKEIINSKINKNRINKNLFIEENFIKIAKNYYKIFFLNRKKEQLKEKKVLYKDLLEYLNSIRSYKKVPETKLLLLSFKMEKIEFLLKRIERKKESLLDMIEKISEIDKKYLKFNFNKIDVNLENWSLSNDLDKKIKMETIKEKNILNNIKILDNKSKYFDTLSKPDFKFTFAYLQRFDQKMTKGSDLFSFTLSMSLPFLDNVGIYESKKTKELINSEKFKLSRLKKVIKSKLNKDLILFNSYKESLKICRKELQPIIDSLIKLNNENISYDNSDFTDIINLKELMINTSIECTDISIKATETYFNYKFTKI